MDGQIHLYGHSNGEYRGYCAGVQAQDGMIHIISSWNHYEFNLAWLCSPTPAID
jgi:formylglycine-generating enzyme